MEDKKYVSFYRLLREGKKIKLPVEKGQPKTP